MNYSWQTLTCGTLIVVGVVGVVILIKVLQRQAQKRAWGEMASQLGLVCESGRYPWSSLAVRGMYRGHALVLDTFVEHGYRRSQTYTQIVMTVNNSAGLRLMLHEASVASRVGKRLGVQDIQVGDADIDRRFMIKGQPEEGVRRLLAAEALRQKLLSVSSIHLTLEGAAIRYQHRGVEKGTERLHSLFDLMSEFATAVEQIG